MQFVCRKLCHLGSVITYRPPLGDLTFAVLPAQELVFSLI